LDDRTIVYGTRVASVRHPWLIVSPFYSALHAHLMPPRSAERVTQVKKPGNCPFLAVLCWDWCMSQPRLRHMPFPSALPYGCSRWTEHRRGWKRRDLHRRCISEVGITHIDKTLRQLMVRWFDRNPEAKIYFTLACCFRPRNSRPVTSQWTLTPRTWERARTSES